MWSVPKSSKLTLVCAPTIDLLGQLAKTYQDEMGMKPEHWFAVCSRDPSLEDEADDSVIDIPHSTSSRDLSWFLSKKGSKIIFSTYDSLHTVVQEVTDKGLRIDYGVFDEAHHLAGNGPMSEVQKLDLKNGLLLTATPKHVDFDPSVREAFSMNDPEVFGPVAYSMGFRESVEAGVVVPFRVMIATSEIESDLRRVSLESRNRMMYISLVRFKKETGTRKLLSKHATVAEAESFAKFLSAKGVRAVTINSGTKRPARITIFKEVETASEIVTTYSECLNEGIDFPSVDGICFFSSNKSTRVIVQAVGRTSRKAPGKTCSYIMIPAYTKDDELASSSYKALGSTLLALAEADSALAQEIRLSTGPETQSGTNLPRAIIMNAPELRRIGMRVLERIPSMLDRKASGKATAKELTPEVVAKIISEYKVGLTVKILVGICGILALVSITGLRL